MGSFKPFGRPLGANIFRNKRHHWTQKRISHHMSHEPAYFSKIRFFNNPSAQQGFFSQNARLVKEYVCANFERIRRGTLIDSWFAYNFFPYTIFWFFFAHCLWVSLGYLLIPHLPIWNFFWGSKSRKVIFLGGFDPLDIRAQQGFFSQNARLVKEYVCANFERIPRGTLIDPKTLICI